MVRLTYITRNKTQAELLQGSPSSRAYRPSRTDLQVVSCGRLYFMRKWNEAVSKENATICKMLKGTVKP
jgi:hypothetical protein